MTKRKYGAWKEDMERALAAYRNNEKPMGFNECCRQYDIPKPTLKRHLDRKNVKANDATKCYGRTCILPPEVETQLVEHILELENLFFGITINDVRKLAYQTADQNKTPHNFNKDSQMAGKKWFYGFKARHKELSLREPEATSLLRVKGFNTENVNEFFDILEKIVDENQIDATRIYNVDESGLSTVQNKCRKVLALKGKRQVGGISSGERGVNTTIVCCASASGNYVPPMLIFKRLRMATELMVGAPPGALADISETGYMTSELFVKWIKHFIDFVKPSLGKKVLLVLDGHTTHSKNLEALEEARSHGIIMLQLPGHTTHRVQPLDKSFFKPLKGYYTQAVEKWLRTNPGLCVTQYQVTQLASEAYGKAATIENSINGFRGGRVWPVDRGVFKDSDFLPAENLNVTDLEEHDENVPPSQEIKARDLLTPIQDNNSNNSAKDDTVTPDIPINHSTNSSSKTATVISSILPVPILTISPIPKPKKGKKSSTQKATVLTSSPYKNSLEMAKKLQIAQATVKELKHKLNLNKLCAATEEKNNKEIEKKQKKKKSEVTLSSPSTSKQPEIIIEPDEWFCNICELISVEDMVKCLRCSLWVHETCAGVKLGQKIYLC